MTLSVEVETARARARPGVPQAALRGSAGGDRTANCAAAGRRAQVRNDAASLRTLDAAEVLDGPKERDTVLRGRELTGGSNARARTVPCTTSVAAPTAAVLRATAAVQPCVDRHHGAAEPRRHVDLARLRVAWRCASCAKGACRPCSSSWRGRGRGRHCYISALISGLQANTLAETLGAQAHVTLRAPDDLVTRPPRYCQIAALTETQLARAAPVALQALVRRC